MINRPELLAPAGNYECFLAAVNAGADAVYLAGDKFGARAYAGNFTEDEIIRAIWHAHVFGVKIYLTVNTLVKERELSSVCAFLAPLYEAGLDGVIVQDLGVARIIRDNFPGLKLCASTQMTVTEVSFARKLAEFGFSRVIPARELNLEEIRALCDGCGIEVEVFIHGAMCYSVSGRCLFSSMLGDRSANRGRCAGPCRMEYKISSESVDRKKAGNVGCPENNGKYLLSMKDMVTIDHIPALIEAGVKSFKIEGRMKPPEYVAGIVSVYRKAIDFALTVSPFDQAILNSVYIRTNPGPGYLKGKTGPDMISLNSPAYTKSNEEILERIRREIIEVERKIPVKVFGSFKKNEEAKLTVTSCVWEEKYNKTPEKLSVCVLGPVMQQAQKAPLSRDKIQKALCATGGTVFLVSECLIEADEDIFLPVGQIKELRRQAIDALYEKIVRSYKNG